MISKEAFLCGGCRNEGRCRLGLRTLVLEQDVARAVARCPSAFHGGPEVAHGGWTAAVMDDLIGRALAGWGMQAVTASLTVEYKKPVPVEEPLLAEARIATRAGRRFMMSAALMLATSGGLLASAHGVWVERRPDHFLRHAHEMRGLRDSPANRGHRDLDRE